MQKKKKKKTVFVWNFYDTLTPTEKVKLQNKRCCELPM